MPTGQFIVNRALTTIGLLEQNGTPSPSDSGAVLDELNAMWGAWGIDEGLIYAVIHERFPLQSGLGCYRIGPYVTSGALPDFNAPIPARIYKAYFINVVGGSLTGGSGTGAPTILGGAADIAGATIVDGATVTIGSIPLVGATVGAPVTIGELTPLPAGVFSFGSVNAADSVTVQLFNTSGGPVTLGTNTYSALIVIAPGSVVFPANVTVGDGGTGYAVGDTGLIVNSSGVFAEYVVNTVAAGVVTDFSVTSGGSGYLPGNGYLTQRSGAQPGVGIGFTVNVLNMSNPGQNRNEIKVVNADQYYSHGDLSSVAMTPDELYPDYNPDQDGFARLYVWPILSLGPASIELEMGVNFVDWTLTGNYNIPKHYGDAINWALAFRLISGFGVAIAQQIIDTVTPLAQKAELRLREANRFNRQLPQGSETLEQPQPAKA